VNLLFSFPTNFELEFWKRGTYCALVVASLLNILTPELMKGTPEYIARCQTYEGGISGEPGNEAHGGYTYCGVASLALLNRFDAIDIPRLLNWLVNAQLTVEGGFQGRTNKLVDGCYSFWQGASFIILDNFCFNNSEFIIDEMERKNVVEIQDNRGIFNDNNNIFGGLYFDQIALQEYILACCQDNEGGFHDKPGVRNDYYHTCYCLSGLSISQHNPIHHEPSTTVLGPSNKNLLRQINPLYNITQDAVDKSIEYFREKELNFSK